MLKPRGYEYCGYHLDLLECLYDKILDCEKKSKNLDGSDVKESIDYNGIDMSSRYIKDYTMFYL